MDRRFSEFRTRGDMVRSAPALSSSGNPPPCTLFERQQIPPAANAGRFAADWLPEFAGFSWIAYGAGSQLVLRIISSPEREEPGVNRLFQQVLETSPAPVSDEESSVVSAVNWGPSSSGNVAAAAGSSIFVFNPVALGISSRTTALPLEWKHKSSLAHTSPVAHFSWTGSGDGLFTSAGSKVLMWKLEEGGNFSIAWQAEVNFPQSQCSTTWFHRGLAASSSSHSNSENETHSKGKATIWWWEESSEAEEPSSLSSSSPEPQAVELVHPRNVVDIQWRPAFSDEQQEHRPVLLTSCSDGAARLWMEIDSGKARLEKSSDRSLKPAFFVSAVIEVNTGLQARLGADCFVSWTSESRQNSPGDDVAACEWIVGIGPARRIALWCLHCLDDVSPPRCPRVLLWQQGSLPEPEPEPEPGEAPVSFKGVVHRLQRSVPPTSVDLVEFFPQGLVRSSRVWAPVSSVGSTKSASLDSDSVSKAGGAWGRSSLEFYTLGHSGGEVSVALHPERFAGVAASVDRTGLILLWRTNSLLEPHVEAPGLHTAAWSLSGTITPRREAGFLPGLCWSPVSIWGDKLVLFSGDSRGVSCYIVEKQSGKEKHSIRHHFLCELELPGAHSLEELHVFERFEETLVLARRNDGVVVGWRLGFQKLAEDSLSVSSSRIEDMSFRNGEQVLAFSSAARSSPYDLVSSSENGTIRLWRLSSSPSSWECVGQFTGSPGLFTRASLQGTRLAISRNSGVDVWELVCSSGGFVLFNNARLELPQAPASLSWFEGIDGVSLLGVAAGEEVHVYVQGRSKETSNSGEWIRLAAARASSRVDRLSWGIQGSLVLTSGSRVSVLSNWVETSSREGQTGATMLLRAALSAGSPRSSCHPRFIFELLVNGEQHQAGICLRRLLSFANAQSGDLLELPNVQYRELQKPASGVSKHTTWTFGEPVDDPEGEATNSEAPLSTSELQQLISSVERFSDGSQLLTIVELVQGLERMAQFKYLDQPGQRFTLLVRFNQLLSRDAVESEAWAWALQSECKAELIDMLVSPDKFSWPALRALGAGFWFTDVEQLRPRIEKLARAQFLRQRDAKDCALFYIALDRKSVLSGLCKLSRDERDKPLVEFFARNFKEEKNKTAALKNAYVLMGKHRHELAAAFFLLGEDLDSAVSVCKNNLDDPQLALVICRLAEGSSGRAARLLISQELLPIAETKDRWIASVFQFLLGKRLESVYELVGKEDSCLPPSFCDPHVGEYCRVVLSKPGMEAHPSLLNRAFRISACALEKLGHPLQALKCLQKCVPGDQSTGDGWLSSVAADELSKLTSKHLVSRYLLHILEQLPVWGDSKQASLSEDTILQDITALEKELLVDTTSVIHSLASTSRHYGRPSFGAWLVEKHHLSDRRASEILDSLSTTGPDVLCATMLASADTTRAKLSPAVSGERIEVPEDTGFTTLNAQIDELRRYADQINQLASRSSSSSKLKGSEKSLLAFAIFLGAAWLGKRTKHLLSLVRMMLEIEPLDFETLLRAQPQEDEAELASDEFSWLLLGVAFWKLVSTFVKRQVAGEATGEVSYSGFGRVSPRNSTIESFERLSLAKAAVESAKRSPSSGAGGTGDGRALLSAVACIYGRFRSRLMVRVKELGEDEAESLVKSDENTRFSELWRLLRVDEAARSALLVEGLEKPSKTKWIANSVASETTSSSTPIENLKQSSRFSVKGLLRSHFNTRFGKGDVALRLPGDTLEAMSVNSCSPEQVVIASANKGLVFVDLDTYTSFRETKDNLWGWAGSDSTPVSSPGFKGDSGVGQGGAAVGMGTTSTATKEFRKTAVGFGIPGYAGMAAWSMGWEGMIDYESLDTPATAQNVNTSAMASHPLRPFFLVGARNTHVYLWKFGEASAMATYGVLPAAPPYALASVSSVEFDRCGHRFASSAVDGIVCTWQLEVGGRSNVSPTESHPCFDRHAWDVAFIGESGAIVAATGSSRSGENLVIWNTLAPPSSARLSVACHEGGARCLAMVDDGFGASPLIVTGGKGGDVSVHDWRYISSGKSKRRRNGYPQNNGDNKNSGTDVVWHISNAHSGSITKIRSVPGTSLFLTSSRDGDVKLWDVNSCEMIKHWRRLHEKRVFLQLVPASVTDVRILPDGFISCGTDGVVKHFRLESESSSPQQD